MFAFGAAMAVLLAPTPAEGPPGEAACSDREPIHVRVSAFDSFADELKAVILIDGKAIATTPNEVEVPACSPTFVLRRTDTGEELTLHATPGVMRADFPGRRAALVVSVVGSFDWVLPGWGDGHLLLGGGGGRIDWWGRFVHLSAAVRITNYGYRWVVRPPAWPVVDLFAGLGYAVGTDAVRVHFALDLGAWAYATPTLRATAALAMGKHFVTATFDAHLYPEGLLPLGQSRRPGYEKTPVENFVFWGFQLAYGWRF